MSTRSTKKLATELHSLLVRSRGRCERCSRTSSLECAHIVPRWYAATRTDETAAWCLCLWCHDELTVNPLKHDTFALLTIGPDAYHALKAKAHAGVHATEAFWRAEIVRLRALSDAVNDPTRPSLGGTT